MNFAFITVTAHALYIAVTLQSIQNRGSRALAHIGMHRELTDGDLFT
ncbi:Uncharacterised protein [Vibrio cholerae]|nr:Uncharacterised protein [Vibrio cholerae]